MTTRTAARAATLTAALLAFSLTPSPAQAAPTTHPHGAYVLTLSPTEPGTELPTRVAALWCNPTGGTHPQAAQACDQLTDANGHLHRIPPDPGPCTLEYAPVRLSAIGTWNSRIRRHHSIHTNRCLAIRETGGVIAAF